VNYRIKVAGAVIQQAVIVLASGIGEIQSIAEPCSGDQKNIARHSDYHASKKNSWSYSLHSQDYVIRRSFSFAMNHNLWL
jgi:hypothetical protein